MKTLSSTVSRSLLPCLITLSVFLCGAATAQPINYTYLPFDDPSAMPGATHARGINNAGLVSGWELTTSGSSIGFVRSPAGTFQQIGGGEQGTRINGINNSGVVVGAFLLNNGQPSAVALPPPYTLSAGVGIPPGFSLRDEAFGVNDNYPNNRSVVGTLTQASNSKVIGFQSPSGPDPSVTPGLSNVVSSQIFGLSNNDLSRRFVGTYETSPGVFRGFFQTGSDTASSQLVTVAGASRTDAFATQYNSPFNIPAVVGRYTLGGKDHGYVLPAGDGNILQSLQTIDVAGALGTRLYGINDLGQIVGETESASTHGFVLTPFGVGQLALIDFCLHNPTLCDSQINTGFIGDPQAVNSINCALFPALCNSVDQILSLLGAPNAPAPETFLLASTTGVIAAIPEPATLLLFGIGLAGLLGYRRRSERA